MVYSRKAKRFIRRAFNFTLRQPDVKQYFGPIFLGAIEGKLVGENIRNRFPLTALEAIYITKFIMKKFWR